MQSRDETLSACSVEMWCCSALCCTDLSVQLKPKNILKLKADSHKIFIFIYLFAYSWELLCKCKYLLTYCNCKWTTQQKKLIWINNKYIWKKSQSSVIFRPCMHISCLLMPPHIRLKMMHELKCIYLLYNWAVSAMVKLKYIRKMHWKLYFVFQNVQICIKLWMFYMCSEKKTFDELQNSWPWKQQTKMAWCSWKIQKKRWVSMLLL